MRHKTFELIEAKAEGEAGEFSALASVFGNVDLVGDRMMPGSFKNTLERWRKSGDPIPVVLSHDWDDPMKYVGEADPRAVMETEKGLLVQGKLDIGEGNPVADQVYKLMKKRRLKGWSFGYTVNKEKTKDGVNEVFDVDLIEVGPTLKGLNPEAVTQAVKSMAEEVGDPSLEEKLLPHEEEAAEEPPETVESLQAKLKAAEEQIQELTQKSEAIEGATPEDREVKDRARDPLRERSREEALEILSAGLSKRKPPTPTPEPEPPPLPSREELRRVSRERMLEVLSG